MKTPSCALEPTHPHLSDSSGSPVPSIRDPEWKEEWPSFVWEVSVRARNERQDLYREAVTFLSSASNLTVLQETK